MTTFFGIESLKVTPGINTVLLIWNIDRDPCLSYLRFQKVEIWRSDTNNRSQAVNVAEATRAYSILLMNLQAGKKGYYWVRPVDASGNVGEFFPASSTGGIEATPLAPSLTLELTPDSVTVGADTEGAVDNLSSAQTTVRILEGDADTTGNWQIVLFPSTGIQATYDQYTHIIKITSITPNSDAGYVDVEARRNGYQTLKKRFSVAKLALVAHAKQLKLSATGQVFKIYKNGDIDPPGITVTATLFGPLVGPPQFQVTSGTAILDGSNYSRTILYTNMQTDVITVKAWITEGDEEYSDQITLVKLREGEDAIVAFLTNEAHTLASTAEGVVGDFTGAYTYMKVFLGITDDTQNWTFSKIDSSVTSTLTTLGTEKGKVTVTAMSSAKDDGYVDITAIRQGFGSITKRFTLTKSKSGEGRPGPRGARHYYVSGRSSWSDSVATSVASEDDGPVITDQVTQYNSSTFAETRFWDGSGWATISQVIDGNLLVNGTIGAQKLAAGELITSKAQLGSAVVGTAQIDSLAVTDGKITNLTAAKLTTGTISSAIIDITGGYIRVIDPRTGRVRVQLGFIPGEDYGLAINAFDGKRIMSANGGLDGAYISQLTVDTLQIRGGAISQRNTAVGGGFQMLTQTTLQPLPLLTHGAKVFVWGSVSGSVGGTSSAKAFHEAQLASNISGALTPWTMLASDESDIQTKEYAAPVFWCNNLPEATHTFTFTLRQRNTRPGSVFNSYIYNWAFGVMELYR